MTIERKCRRVLGVSTDHYGAIGKTWSIKNAGG